MAEKASLEPYCRSGEVGEIICGDRWWITRGEGTGRLGRYTKGGLIQLIQETEGLGFEDAVKRTLEASGQPARLPRAAPRDYQKPDSEREGLDCRLRRISRKASVSRKGGAP